MRSNEMTVRGLLELSRGDAAKFPAGDATPVAAALAAVDMLSYRAPRSYVWILERHGAAELPHNRVFSSREKALAALENEVRTSLRLCPGLDESRFRWISETSCAFDGGRITMEVHAVPVGRLKEISRYGRMLNFYIGRRNVRSGNRNPWGCVELSDGE